MMLVLTRKVGDGILIGDDVVIKVVDIRGNSVRIGIEAPRERKIYRMEVYERISAENKAASQWDMADVDALIDNLQVRVQKK